MGEGVNRTLLATVLVAMAVSIGVGAGLAGRPGPSERGTASVETATVSTQVIQVHVAGWVVSSGVVSVREGSIVADAIEAAGGLRPGAMTESINLAAEIFSGDQVVVPGPPSEGGQDDSRSTGEVGGVLSLNRASAAELEELPGVGPVLADRIVAFREESGRFSTVEDLLEVPGIGEAKLAALRDLVRP